MSKKHNNSVLSLSLHKQNVRLCGCVSTNAFQYKYILHKYILFKIYIKCASIRRSLRPIFCWKNTKKWGIFEAKCINNMIFFLPPPLFIFHIFCFFQQFFPFFLASSGAFLRFFWELLLNSFFWKCLSIIELPKENNWKNANFQSSHFYFMYQENLFFCECNEIFLLVSCVIWRKTQRNYRRRRRRRKVLLLPP